MIKKNPSQVILETLFIINFADIQHERNKPILDKDYMEMGTVQLLRKVSQCASVSINARLKRCRMYKFIEVDGGVWNKKERETVKPTGKGRTTRGKNNIVYTLTATGKQYLNKNIDTFDPILKEQIATKLKITRLFNQ